MLLYQFNQINSIKYNIFQRWLDEVADHVVVVALSQHELVEVGPNEIARRTVWLLVGMFAQLLHALDVLVHAPDFGSTNFSL